MPAEVGEEAASGELIQSLPLSLIPVIIPVLGQVVHHFVFLSSSPRAGTTLPSPPDTAGGTNKDYLWCK